MDKNTVLLSVEDYNELRDVKKAVEGRKKIFLSYGWLGDTPAEFLFASEEELNNTLINEKESLNKEINRLKDENYKLKHPDKIEPSIDEIKAMSWWKFRKWKAGRL